MMKRKLRDCGTAGELKLDGSPTVPQLADAPRMKQPQSAKSGVNNSRDMYESKNFVSVLSLSGCCPLLADQRILLQNIDLRDSKRLSAFNKLATEKYLLQHPLTRQTDCPLWIVSHPNETDSREETVMPTTSISIDQIGDSFDIVKGGGGRHGYCLPAEEPSISKTQREACKQRWRVQPTGIYYKGVSYAWLLQPTGIVAMVPPHSA
jgi:hypothetical protein